MPTPECRLDSKTVCWLDSLQPEKFFKITGRDDFNKVWQGLLKARDIGFRVKINVVAMKGINDDEFIDFAQLALREPFQVRFIEFMPLGEKSSWDKEQFIRAEDIKNIICPVDFSKESNRALNNAIIISRLFDAKLVILSVYSPFRQIFTKLDPVEINEQRKSDLIKEFNKFLEEFNLIDVNYIKEIKGGEPAEEILKAIKNYKSDLLLMGTTGKSGINKILMGSVTEKVIREVLCSFITLKNVDAITLELESKIQDIENHYATAQELFEKGFFEESINQFNICLGINYTHIPSLKGIAKVYEKLGDVNSAKKYREMVKNVLDQIWNLKIEQEVRKQINNR